MNWLTVFLLSLVVLTMFMYNQYSDFPNTKLQVHMGESGCVGAFARFAL